MGRLWTTKWQAFGLGIFVGTGATAVALALIASIGVAQRPRVPIKILTEVLKSYKDEEGAFRERLRMTWVNESDSTVEEMRGRVVAYGSTGEVVSDRNDVLVYLSDEGTPAGATHDDFRGGKAANDGAEMGLRAGSPATRVEVAITYAGPMEPEIRRVFDDARSRGVMRE